MTRRVARFLTLLILLAAITRAADAPALAPAVDGQPLGANVQRVIEALGLLGASLPLALADELSAAAQARDAAKLQRLLDPHVLLIVHLNPEARVKIARGVAPARLQQAGFTPVIVKVLNESGGTQRLRLGSVA